MAAAAAATDEKKGAQQPSTGAAPPSKEEGEKAGAGSAGPPPTDAKKDEAASSTPASADGDQPSEEEKRILDEKRRVEEDAILQKAQIAKAAIAARVASARPPAPTPPRNRAHWDYVMAEMAWLAHDVAQERRWRKKACAKFCHEAAVAVLSKKKKVEAAAATKKATTRKTRKRKDRSPSPSPSEQTTLDVDAHKGVVLCYQTTSQTAVHTSTFFKSLQQQHEDHLKLLASERKAYELRLESHRKSVSAVLKMEAALESRARVNKAKAEVARAARAYEQALRSVAEDADDDELLLDVGRKKKGKRSKKKKGGFMDHDGLVPFDDEDLIAPRGKKLKTMDSGDPLSTFLLGEGGDLFATPPSMQAAKSKKKKKQQHQQGKKGIQQKQKGGAKGQPGLYIGRSESSFFGEKKTDIAHLLQSKAQAARGEAGSQPTTSKKKKKGSTVPANPLLAELLKIQSREGKKRPASSSKKGKKVDKDQGEVPWTVAEDQVLCAIVHEFGSNWAIVADVLGSTYTIRGIYRRPHSCRQRFKWICSSSSVVSSHPQAKQQQQQQQQQAGGPGADPSQVPNAPPPVPYLAALKINKQNARVLLHHVMPADEDTLKRHVDVVSQVTSKYRNQKAQMEHNKSKEGMHVVDMHPSHKNAQAIASRGQMLMNPGALCEYVNSQQFKQSAAAKMGQPGQHPVQMAEQQQRQHAMGGPMPGQQGRQMHMSASMTTSLMLQNDAGGRMAAGPPGSLQQQHAMQMVSSPRMHQQGMHQQGMPSTSHPMHGGMLPSAMAAKAGRVGVQGQPKGPLGLSVGGQQFAGAGMSTDAMSANAMQTAQMQRQQQYMMAYGHAAHGQPPMSAAQIMAQGVPPGQPPPGYAQRPSLQGAHPQAQQAKAKAKKGAAQKKPPAAPQVAQQPPAGAPGAPTAMQAQPTGGPGQAQAQPQPQPMSIDAPTALASGTHSLGSPQPATQAGAAPTPQGPASSKGAEGASDAPASKATEAETGDKGKDNAGGADPGTGADAAPPAAQGAPPASK